jgi:hypothetical protein
MFQLYAVLLPITAAAGGSAGRLILLSGTPSLSRPYDLYRQVDVLAPGLLGRNKEEFAHRCSLQAAQQSTAMMSAQHQ